MTDAADDLSAEHALRRAFWMVKPPSMAVLLAPVLTYVVLGELELVPTIGSAGLRWFLPAFLSGFVGGWLVWSIQVPRWRLWAYHRVWDIAELKRQAVERRVIWPDGSIFEKTELMSRQVREERRALEVASNGRTGA
jgi:hypothetical protein